MAVFLVQTGAFDVDRFELAEIVLDTVVSTPTEIDLLDGETTWELFGTAFSPVGEGVLPTAGFVQTIRKVAPEQSYVTIGDEPLPVAQFVAAVEANATDALLDTSFAGADVLVGGDEADVLFGREGDDTMTGGPGDDELRGGPGNDRLFGDEGDDTLIGGPGDDLMDGGPGADLFVFDPSEPEEGADTVLGVDVAEDRIQLSAEAIVAATTDVDLSAATTPEELAAAMDESALWTLGPGATGAATITHPNGSVTLADVPAEAVPVDSFAGLLDAGALVIEDGGAAA
jgi:hypothetical protein